MKKIILLLAALALYANAITCLDIAEILGSDWIVNSDEYKVDSSAIEGSTVNHWYTYEGKNIQSIYSCEDGECYTYNFGSYDTTANLITRGDEYETSTYFIDRDSVVWTSTEGSFNYMELTFRRNDTLYREFYSKLTTATEFNLYDAKTRTVMDPSDDKVCREEYTEKGTLSGGSIQIEFNGSILIVHENNTAHNGDSNIYYFSKFDDGITTIHKYHPAAAIKQYHYFDLMGRPAKGKNTIKVVK